MEKKKILIIDDERNIRMTLTYCLESEGYQVDTAINGEEGLDILLNQKKIYDLILLDIMLPGIDGIEILKEVRKNPKTQHTPIIMLTARGSEYDKITFTSQCKNQCSTR